MTQPVWIEDMGNLHCPTCDARLVAQAVPFKPLGKPAPTYHQDGNPPRCPVGHPVPGHDELLAYAAAKGHGPVDPGSVREVPPPK